MGWSPNHKRIRPKYSPVPNAEEARHEARLGDVLAYDPPTGRLTWKPRTPEMFSGTGVQSAAHNCAIWNGRFAGKLAIDCPDKRGYLTGHLFGQPIKAHRVAWEIAHGAAPKGEIDHINGDPADNRLCNLRDVTHAENGRNLKLKRNNTSGHCGVSRRPSGRWVAHITVGGKRSTIGTFDTAEEAAEARVRASEVQGFHANHGAVR